MWNTTWRTLRRYSPHSPTPPKRHRLAHGHAGPGAGPGGSTGPDRPTWRLSVLNASGEVAFAAIAVPDPTGDLRVFGWFAFLPGRQSF